jgi:MFS family permease
VGAAICGYVVTESLGLLLVLRLITGMGEAAFYVGVASVINDISPDDRRGEALSYFSLALFGGLAVGPVLGETVLDASGFDMAWIVAGVAAAVAGLLGIWVPETRPEGIEDLPRKIINRGALLPGAVLATNIWALATFNSFIPLYALDLGLSGSRFVFAVNSVIIISIRLFGARLPDKLGVRKSSRVALTSTAVGLATIGLWHSTAGLFLGTAIYSVGHAMAFPALMTLAINRAPASERGSVVGTFTAFFDLSFGVGAVAAGVIANAFGYRGAFFAASVVAVMGLGLLGAASRRSRQTTAEIEAEEAVA